VSELPGFFPNLGTQPVKPASADVPAIAAADLMNFLRVELAILCLFLDTT
jgi:hypothetical protein